MRVTVEWYNEDRRTLRYTFAAGWQWNEYYDALQQGRAMMRSTEYVVCIINDLHQLERLPDDFMERTIAIAETRPVNTGLVSFVNARPYFQHYYQAFIAHWPDGSEKYILVDDIEDAVKQIQVWLEDNS